MILAVLRLEFRVGAFRCKSNVPVQYMDMLVLRKMDKVSYRLAEELESAGHPSFVVPAQETEWSLKRASYGRLSTRHLGVEAGLGTLGLEVNILTPEFGPRIYLTGVLTSQSQSLTLLNNVSTPNVAGASLFVGYGSSAASMLSGGVFQTAVSIPGAVQCTARTDSAPAPWRSK